MKKKILFPKDIPIWGEGMFAKRDIKNGEHVAYYAGMMQNNTNERPIFPNNMTEEQMWERLSCQYLWLFKQWFKWKSEKKKEREREKEKEREMRN